MPKGVELLGTSASDAMFLHLALGDHVHEFDAAQEDAGTTKILEAQHTPCAPLVDSAVQILPLASDLDIRFIHSPAPADGFLWRRKAFSRIGNTLMAQRCTVEWSTEIPRSAIISSTCRRLSG
jgi:hypothetical protein